jgi:uncharacterized protein (DUF1778 family)
MKPAGKPAADRKEGTRDAADRAKRTVLSERDTVQVLALLENPPKPTPALMAAARRRIART